MRTLIKILSIITVVWTSLTLINFFWFIVLTISDFFGYYRNYGDNWFVIAFILILQTCGIIILAGFLVSLLGLNRKNKPVEIE